MCVFVFQREKKEHSWCFFVKQIQVPNQRLWLSLFINKLRRNKPNNNEVSCVAHGLLLSGAHSRRVLWLPANEALPNKVKFYQDSTAFLRALCQCFSPCCVSLTAAQKLYCMPCVHAKRRLQMDRLSLYRLSPAHSLSLSTSTHRQQQGSGVVGNSIIYISWWL